MTPVARLQSAEPLIFESEFCNKKNSPLIELKKYLAYFILS